MMMHKKRMFSEFKLKNSSNECRTTIYHMVDEMFNVKELKHKQCESFDLKTLKNISIVSFFSKQ